MSQILKNLWMNMCVGETINNNFKNIFFQNKEILYALDNKNLFVNLTNFFFIKSFLIIFIF